MGFLKGDNQFKYKEKRHRENVKKLRTENKLCRIFIYKRILNKPKQLNQFKNQFF